MAELQQVVEDLKKRLIELESRLASENDFKESTSQRLEFLENNEVNKEGGDTSEPPPSEAPLSPSSFSDRRAKSFSLQLTKVMAAQHRIQREHSNTILEMNLKFEEAKNRILDSNKEAMDGIRKAADAEIQETKAFMKEQEGLMEELVSRRVNEASQMQNLWKTSLEDTVFENINTSEEKFCDQVVMLEELEEKLMGEINKQSILNCEKNLELQTNLKQMGENMSSRASDDKNTSDSNFKALSAKVQANETLLKRLISDVAADKAQYEKEISTLQQQLANAVKESSRLEILLDGSNNRHQDKADGISKTVGEIQEALSTCSSSVTNHESRLIMIQKKITGLQSEGDARNRGIQLNTNSLSTLQQDVIDKLPEKFDNVSASLLNAEKKLERKITANLSTAETCKEKLEKLSQEFTSHAMYVKTNLPVVEKQASVLEERLASMDVSLVQVIASSELNHTRIEKNRADNEALNHKINEMKKIRLQDLDSASVLEEEHLEKFKKLQKVDESSSKTFKKHVKAFEEFLSKYQHDQDQWQFLMNQTNSVIEDLISSENKKDAEDAFSKQAIAVAEAYLKQEHFQPNLYNGPESECAESVVLDVATEIQQAGDLLSMRLEIHDHFLQLNNKASSSTQKAMNQSKNRKRQELLQTFVQQVVASIFRFSPTENQQTCESRKAFEKILTKCLSAKSNTTMVGNNSNSNNMMNMLSGTYNNSSSSAQGGSLTNCAACDRPLLPQEQQLSSSSEKTSRRPSSAVPNGSSFVTRKIQGTRKMTDVNTTTTTNLDRRSTKKKQLQPLSETEQSQSQHCIMPLSNLDIIASTKPQSNSPRIKPMCYRPGSAPVNPKRS